MPPEPGRDSAATDDPDETQVLPWDVYNQELVHNVRPPDWIDPTPAPRYNLVVIGAGTAGLVSAMGAAGLGAKVALVERNLMGGDCLNVGCVPSKCLIRSSRVVADIWQARDFGINVAPGFEADFPAVMERMRRLRAALSHHDSARRLAAAGVDVFLGQARFSGRDTISVGPHTLRFKRAVIATGARPVPPVVPGLLQAGCLTNETIFNLTLCPGSLAVIGGGPLGCEMAQAFQRLGSQVTLIHQNAHILDREDPDAAAIVEQTFRREGIELLLNARIIRVGQDRTRKVVHCESEGRRVALTVDDILVGTGRAPNVEGLNLEEVGVEFDPHDGVRVNDRLQTTNRRIYAAGDVCMRWKFTHAADAAARIVIQNSLFGGRKKLSSLNMPWTTYTDPEIAHVGRYASEARDAGVALDTFTRDLKEVDRAVVDGEDEGFVKIHVHQGTDRIWGATIVARHAGEMISEISVAMAAGMGLGKLAAVIHPYPTQAEAIRQVADAYNRSRLTPTLRRLLSRWFSWRR